MPFDLFLSVLLVALVVDGLIGYPTWLFRMISHPVVWMGTLIDRLDKALNQESLPEGRRRLNGVFAIVCLLIVVILPLAWLQIVLLDVAGFLGTVLILALPTAFLIAQKSLYDHVAPVAMALEAEGLGAARQKVAMIVGRDPESLDAAAVGRAAIESLAENFSDGVTAPAVWAAIGGLPGIAAYKAINTSDSMIGHKTDRHGAFGWAAARLDDLINLPASRLTALWLILAALITPKADPRAALQSVLRDARHHRSPNAGWPEAAMAGALGIRLGGPRAYPGYSVEDAWMGNGRADVTPADIWKALQLYRRACLIQAMSVAVVLALIWRA